MSPLRFPIPIIAVEIEERVELHEMSVSKARPALALHRTSARSSGQQCFASRAAGADAARLQKLGGHTPCAATWFRINALKGNRWAGGSPLLEEVNLLPSSSTRISPRVILGVHRVISLWLFGDFMYAVLPIIVVAVVQLLIDADFARFALVKEWSFATIVLLGVTIRRLIRLKVKVQQTPRSYTLDTGVQAHIALLIGAVLVLALVIMVEHRLLTLINAVILGKVQVSLFAFSVLTLIIAIVAEEDTLQNVANLPSSVSRRWALRHTGYKVEQCEDAIEYVCFALDRVEKLSHVETSDVGLTLAVREEARLRASLAAALQRLELAIGSAREKAARVT